MTALALSPTTQPQRAVLRLHRPALTVWGAFLLLAVGALLWVHLFRAPAERHPVDQYFVLTDVNNVMNFLGEVLSYVSIAVAAWAGAALVGRELETGTARLAWTQSVTPVRWLTAQLGAAALPLTAGTTVLGLVYAWVWTGDQDVLVTDWSYDRVLVPAGPLSVALVLFALAAGDPRRSRPRPRAARPRGGRRGHLRGAVLLRPRVGRHLALPPLLAGPAHGDRRAPRPHRPRPRGRVRAARPPYEHQGSRRMTALAVDPTVRPRPARMWRTVLRLHRAALIGWAVLVAAVSGALLWAYGPGASAARADWQRRCTAHGCDWSSAISLYHTAYTAAEAMIGWVPYLVAAWAGAVLARELERGTTRLAWTQGVSPTRWLATTLALPAVLVTAGSTVMVLLHRLLFDAHKVPMSWNWWNDETFTANGTLAVVYPLLGFAVGALAGQLQRHTLTAAGLAIAVMGLARTTLAFARPYLWPWATSTGADYETPRNVLYGEGVPSPPPVPTSPTRCAATARRA